MVPPTTSDDLQFLTALDIHIDVSHRNFFELKLWSPSRWSKRMRQDSAFPMDANGRIRVPASGVYFVYAQVWDDAGLPLSNLGVILRQFLNNPPPHSDQLPGRARRERFRSDRRRKPLPTLHHDDPHAGRDHDQGDNVRA